MKKESGITLIALVVTIIVLLILAGVSLSLTIGENGIINKAQNGVEKHSDAEVKEKLEIAYAAYEIAKKTQSDYTIEQALEQSGLNVIAVDENDNNEISVTVGLNGTEKKYTLSTQGIKIPKTLEDYGLQIGDRINYDELSNGTKTCSITAGTGLGKINNWDQDSNGNYILNINFSYSTENLTWVVLGVDNFGRLELISENPTSATVDCANYESWLYAPDELNRICKILYGAGNFAEDARSLNARDINKLAGINTEEDLINLYPNYKGAYKFRFPTLEQASNPDENETPTTDESKLRIQRRYYDGVSWGKWIYGLDDGVRFIEPGKTTIDINHPGETEEYRCTDYSYMVNEKVLLKTRNGTDFSNILCKQNVNQILADHAVWCNSQRIDGYMRMIQGFWHGRQNVLETVYGNVYAQKNLCFRPVVILKSDIKLSGNVTDGWTIQ